MGVNAEGRQKGGGKKKTKEKEEGCQRKEAAV